MKLRVLVADDHQIFREGLRTLLEDHHKGAEVLEAKNGRETVDQALSRRPHVVVMDITMPVLNGIEATRQILTEAPQTKIIGLSMHVEQRLVSEMLNAGAKGYLPKQCASNELLQAVHAVRAGQTYLSPMVTGQLVDNFVRRRPQPQATAFSQLTDREREILQLLSEGCSVKEIGGQLSVSIKTVHTHRQHIMEKLQIDNLAELTKYAIREGLTSL